MGKKCSWWPHAGGWRVQFAVWAQLPSSVPINIYLSLSTWCQLIHPTCQLMDQPSEGYSTQISWERSLGEMNNFIPNNTHFGMSQFVIYRNIWVFINCRIIGRKASIKSGVSSNLGIWSLSPASILTQLIVIRHRGGARGCPIRSECPGI